VKNLQFNEKGLIPAIAQDADTGEVLMLGYMDKEALRRTLSSGEVWFYSRSRQELWHKGETSGNRIKVVSVWKDCDSDTILVKGKATGPVCHTGNKTCFFEQLTPLELDESQQKEA
jgi:phosphoribosyl-ATP pyrophosphohydrolase/phosphoribosyl-AMP cyclohydrolase